MGVSKILRILFRIVLFVITISLSLTSLLGGLSAVMIFSNFDENIDIKTDEAELKNFNNPALAEFVLPFSINNTGYFPLEGLELRIELELIYDEDKIADFMDHSTTIDAVIMPLQSYDGTFTAGADSFTFHPEINPWQLENKIYVSVEVGAYYSFRMLHFEADIDRFDVGINWVSGVLG
jgi:hypothetical protein